MPVAVIDEALAASVDGQAIGIEDLYPRLALAVSRSSKGAALLDRLEQHLAPEGRTLEGLRRDLSQNEDLAAALVAGLSAALARSQDRVVRQVRELGQMRQLTERSLQHFERLEAFVWQTAKCERNLVLSLARRADSPVLELAEQVEQRLPTDSIGLSDVGVWIDAAAEGRLTVALTLLESAETLAEWQVSDPQAGWLRLALPRALGSDAQTPVLRLTWEGTAPLALGLSHDHPDPRLQCRGGPMLALRLWKFIPGTHSPLSPESLAPMGQPARGRWLIGLSAFHEAATRAADPEHVEVVDWQGGLVLRPEPGQALAIPLPGMGRSGLQRLQAMVRAEGEAAEVAFALSAPGEGPEPSAWQSLAPDAPEQALLVLPSALAETRDLWVMARAKGKASARVIVERIEGFASATGQEA